jgi:acylphosphatase
MEEYGVHVLVTGKVQGVYYRETTRKKAKAHDITGWVRNCSDGRVELKAFGPKEGVDQFLRFCRKGPVLARVKSLDMRECQVEAHDDFLVMS